MSGKLSNNYSDIRCEKVINTVIVIDNTGKTNYVNNEKNGGYYRSNNNGDWSIISTTSLKELQSLKEKIENSNSVCNPLNERSETNIHEKTSYREKFADSKLKKMTILDKKKYIMMFFSLLRLYMENDRKLDIKYQDFYLEKEYLSVRGVRTYFDYFFFKISIRVMSKKNVLIDTWEYAGNKHEDINDSITTFIEYIETIKIDEISIEKIKSGRYDIIFSPQATGFFIHECIGHSCEADNWDSIDKAYSWYMNKRVGINDLNIVDDGNFKHAGFTPYDDEGTKAHKTYLVKNGYFNSFLTSTSCFPKKGTVLTGNARAKDFTFPSIVRMTNTYMEAGSSKIIDMLNTIDNGLYIHRIEQGSGIDYFTLKPCISYRIVNGEIRERVFISLIAGQVIEYLGKIEYISDDFKMYCFTDGGCGKNNQYPLRVSYGGPYIKLKGVDVL